MTSMENSSGKGGVKQTVVGLEKRKDLSVCMPTGRRGFWYEAGRKTSGCGNMPFARKMEAATNK